MKTLELEGDGIHQLTQHDALSTEGGLIVWRPEMTAYVLAFGTGIVIAVFN